MYAGLPHTFFSVCLCVCCTRGCGCIRWGRQTCGGYTHAHAWHWQLDTHVCCVAAVELPVPRLPCRHSAGSRRAADSGAGQQDTAGQAAGAACPPHALRACKRVRRCVRVQRTALRIRLIHVFAALYTRTCTQLTARGLSRSRAKGEL